MASTRLTSSEMYILYSDESGVPHDACQRYFVLAGFCVFERQGYWISKELDKIAARFNPDDPSEIELHGSPMFQGRSKGQDSWRRFPVNDRVQAILDALRIFVDSHQSNRLFASVVDKAAVSSGDPVEAAFEQVASRFDLYLTRLHRSGSTHRGVIIFDKSTYDPIACCGFQNGRSYLGHTA